MDQMSIDQKISNLRAALADLGQDTRQWSDEDLVQRVLSGGPSRLPAWADKPVEERLEELRAEADPSRIQSDAELLGLALNHAWAEAQRHHNAYSMILQDLSKELRAVRTEAHRAAVADITAQAGLYLQAIIRRNAQPIDGVIYRAEQIPEDGRLPVAKARELREAAIRARSMLSGLSSSSALADAAKDEDVQALEALKTELRRVQGVIAACGRKLHAEYGKTSGFNRAEGFRCECVGCELIREVNDRV